MCTIRTISNVFPIKCLNALMHLICTVCIYKSDLWAKYYLSVWSNFTAPFISNCHNIFLMTFIVCVFRYFLYFLLQFFLRMRKKLIFDYVYFEWFLFCKLQPFYSSTRHRENNLPNHFFPYVSIGYKFLIYCADFWKKETKADCFA